jgi:hypothetical protein
VEEKEMTELEALKAIYSALSFSIRKHGEEMDPWVKECVEAYEKQFVDRSQWINPGYQHGSSPKS